MGHGAAEQRHESATCPGGFTPFFSVYQQDAYNIYHNYFQLHNPLRVPFSLEEYSIMFCVNGCAIGGHFETMIQFPADAVIPAGGTYTLCTDPGLFWEPHCQLRADIRLMAFTGDDFVAFVRSRSVADAGAADIVDSIGVLTTADPGSHWPVCASASTRNTKLIRNTKTCCGNRGSAAEFSRSAPTCSWTGEGVWFVIEEWEPTPDACVPPATTTVLPPRRDGGPMGAPSGAPFLSHIVPGDVTGMLLAGMFLTVVMAGIATAPSN